MTVAHLCHPIVTEIKCDELDLVSEDWPEGGVGEQVGGEVEEEQAIEGGEKAGGKGGEGVVLQHQLLRRRGKVEGWVKLDEDKLLPSARGWRRGERVRGS